jgi:MoxR-like ATPase
MRDDEDMRAPARAVGALLGALGQPTQEDIVRANQGLKRLALPTLRSSDFQHATPESLARAIPEQARAGVLALMRDLAAGHPIRTRLLLTYARLWGEEKAIAIGNAEENSNGCAKEPGEGNGVLRWMVGPLPSHVTAAEAAPGQAPYRDGGMSALARGDSELKVPTLRDRVAKIGAEFAAVRDAVERVIVGKRSVVERVLMAMAARGHVLLVDVPGTGKTQLCKAIAAAIDLSFARVQMTPDLLPLDITGANIYDPRDRRFVFRPGPVFTQLLLADEINRATPKTQSALLEVMEERAVTIDGKTHALEAPFLVLATMNPLDHQGTYALPAAQIDRFMVMLEVGYPSPDDEVQMLDRHLGVAPALSEIAPVICATALVGWQETVPLIHVAPAVKRAVVDWVHALRAESPDRATVSPRATLLWVRLAQARAMLLGREFVTVEDLLEVAPDVLSHRLFCDGESARERMRAATHKLGSMPLQ